MAKKFFLVFLILSGLVSLGSEPRTFGWETFPSYSEFYMGGKKVFDSRETVKAIPQNLSENELIEFVLVLGEFYTVAQDKENLSNLIVLLRKEKEDYKLLDTLLAFFWKLEKAEYSDAEAKLADYISKEKDSYLSNLGSTILYFLKRKPESRKFSHEDIAGLGCSASKKYFSLCKLLKVRIHLEYITSGSDGYSREYPNLDRLIAPFFEDAELAYIPFLEKLIPDFAPKLAYLGFSSEAVYFQKMILVSEKIHNRFELVSFERLSFYQMIGGDLVAAEETLALALKSLKSVTVMKNNLLLKLGMIAYLRNDYKQSLSYLTQLNFQYWGRTLRNPISDEQISVNGARDLIAIAIWKGRSAAMAVKALSNMNSSRPDEEELFMKLRIAHILFKERANTTEKMTDDIIYIAQGKGWKRVEYAATLLNGFTNIINKKYRKAVIQFTKSYGILGGSDPGFTNEWIRQSGMLLSRIYARERGNHALSFLKLIRHLHENNEESVLLAIKLFLDDRYNVEEFKKAAVNHFMANKKYEYLLETLYYNQLSHVSNSSLKSKSTLQIPQVNKRILGYKGFRPALDNIYFKGTNNKIRMDYSSYLYKQNDMFDISSLKKATVPIIGLFEFQGQYFAISYQPERGNWNVQVFNSTEYKSSLFYNRLISSFSFTDKDSRFQIFFNEEGMGLFQYLRKQKMGYGATFFSSFSSKSDRKSKSLDLVGVDCDDGNTLNGVENYSTEYFEGSKIFPESNRLHVWKFKEATSKDVKNRIETYSWKCNSSSVSLGKLQRRLDKRTIPSSILFINPLFHSNSPNQPSMEFFDWADFWIRKGVNNVYFVDRLGSDTESDQALRVLSFASPDSDDYGKLQELLNSSGRESLFLSREVK